MRVLAGRILRLWCWCRAVTDGAKAFIVYHYVLRRQFIYHEVEQSGQIYPFVFILVYELACPL